MCVQEQYDARDKRILASFDDGMFVICLNCCAEQEKKSVASCFWPHPHSGVCVCVSKVAKFSEP